MSSRTESAFLIERTPEALGIEIAIRQTYSVVALDTIDITSLLSLSCLGWSRAVMASDRFVCPEPYLCH